MKPANGAEFSVEAGGSAVDRSAEGGVKDRAGRSTKLRHL